MARLGPPFWPQKSPRKSLCGSLFCILSQEMRHINFFLWAQNGVFWVGAKKLMLKMCFFSPLSFPEAIFLLALPQWEMPKSRRPSRITKIDSSLQLDSGAWGPPQFSKGRSENAGANENLSCGFPPIPGIAPRVAPRIAALVLLKSWDTIPRMGFFIPKILFWTPRAAPRIARNSPRAPRMAFPLRERFSWNWCGSQASDWCTKVASEGGRTLRKACFCLLWPLSGVSKGGFLWGGENLNNWGGARTGCNN